MSIQLGSAYGKVSLDVKGLLNGVKQGKEGLLEMAAVGEKVGGAMKSLGNTLTIGLTLPIAAIGAASVKAASDFEETKNKAVVVFGDMADSILANANKASTTLGLSKTQYLDYASALGAAFTAGGLGIKDSADLASQAVKNFADLASFHNARVEDVAAAWQSAIRGQYEPIQKYFPFITDSYLRTYGTANGLVDANTKNLTANQRAIILNAIALDSKLNPAINDFAETSGGLANQGRILKAQWQDALILLGENLLPIALKLVNVLNALLEKFNQLSPTQQKVVLGFLAAAAALGPVLSLLGTLITTVSGVVGAISALGELGISFAGIGTAISGVLVPAIAAIGTALVPIIVILAAIALAVGLALIAWKTNFLGFRDTVQTFVKVFSSLWKALLAFLRGDTDGALQYLGEAFDAWWEHIQKVFAKFNGLREAFSRFLDFLRNAISSAVSYISRAFQNVDWGKVGKYILLGIANGMLFGLPSLLLTVAHVAEQVLGQIKKSLGISSPSKEAMKLGMFTAQGFLQGMQQVSPEDMARSLTSPITNSNTSNQQTIIQHFATGVTISQVRGMIADNNEQLMNSMINALGGN